MRVVLADTQADVRSALRLLVTHDLGMQVVGEVTDAAGLWRQVHDARRTCCCWSGACSAPGPVPPWRACMPCIRICGSLC